MKDNNYKAIKNIAGIIALIMASVIGYSVYNSEFYIQIAAGADCFKCSLMIISVIIAVKLLD